MYDRHIDTFLAAARAGSFSKAAELLYISPSAVLQQVAALEQSLSVRLFSRGNRGITLTPAGAYFFQEAQALVQRTEEVRRELKRLDGQSDRCIRVGVNYFHTLRAFYKIWFHFQQSSPEDTLQTIPIGDESPAALEGIDLLEGLYFKEPWQKDFEFIPVGHTPICVAFSHNHPLSKRKLLSPRELAGIPILTIHQGLSREMDAAAHMLAEVGAQMESIQFYDPAAFLRCITQKRGILLTEYWHDLNTHLTVVPIEWDGHYGFFIKKPCTGAVSDLARFIRQSACNWKAL